LAGHSLRRIIGRWCHTAGAAVPEPRGPACATARMYHLDSDNKESPMSKGMDRKKEDKKKPAKTMEEKRAAKREKKSKR
jgi:hypothetical protein